jgi:hypothetical protein
MPPGHAEQHRFGRVARIPTPTPLGVGDGNSYLVFPPRGDGVGARGEAPSEGVADHLGHHQTHLRLIDADGSAVIELRDGREVARAA